MRTISVYVLESQPIMYAGLEHILKGDGRFNPLGFTAETDAAVEYVGRHSPDLLVISQLDVSRAVLSSIQRVQSLKSSCSIVLWVHSLHHTDAVRAVQAGARGIVRKSLPVQEFVECLFAVANGGIWVEDALLPNMGTVQNARQEKGRISAREKQVIELICRNLRNKDIADEMGIAESTVKVHLLHIYEKTGVTDRFQLALEGRRILAQLGNPDDV